MAIAPEGSQVGLFNENAEPQRTHGRERFLTKESPELSSSRRFACIRTPARMAASSLMTQSRTAQTRPTASLTSPVFSVPAVAKREPGSHHARRQASLTSGIPRVAHEFCGGCAETALHHGSAVSRAERIPFVGRLVSLSRRLSRKDAERFSSCD